MKTVVVLSFLMASPIVLWSQPGVPPEVEFVLTRIEHGIRSGAPEQFEDLIESGFWMRLEDSLYKDLSNIQAFDLLKKYFAERDSIRFSFTTLGSGRMISTKNHRRDTVAVDVWITRRAGSLVIHAMNFSNYPTATIFFDNRN